MSQILIFSRNEELVAFWSSVLSTYYKIDTISAITTDITAAITIIDADEIIKNKQLVPLLSKRSTRFLIVGTDWSESDQIEILSHGAAGYCDKTDSPNQLLQAIKCILKGDVWIQRHLVSKVIEVLVQMKSDAVETHLHPKDAESTQLLLTLSNREYDVAKMIRTGSSNKTIASSLVITERTVKAHLTSIYKKLSIPDRLHLALFIKEFD